MLTTEHQAVVTALGQLPPRQREVLVLRYYGGMSEAEIATATGVSRGTVKSSASRALDALQRILEHSRVRQCSHTERGCSHTERHWHDRAGRSEVVRRVA